MGHLTVETARWVPRTHPFDKDVRGRIALRAAQLAQQAPQARTAEVERSIEGTAAAFQGVSRAMATRRRTAVNQSIQGVRARYRQLKVLCSWNR